MGFRARMNAIEKYIFLKDAAGKKLVSVGIITSLRGIGISIVPGLTQDIFEAGKKIVL